MNTWAQLEIDRSTRSLHVQIVGDGRTVLGTFFVTLPDEVVKAFGGYHYPGNTFADGFTLPPSWCEWQKLEARIRPDEGVYVPPTEANPEGK